MKKTILTGTVLILMLLFITSCGVPQEDYDSVSSDLAAAQTQIQSLQGDLTEAQAQTQSLQGDLTEAQAQIQSLESNKEATEEKEKCAEALAYAEFLDVLMYPAWKEAGTTLRFEFEDDVEWFIELKNRSSIIGDTELSSYLKELEKGQEAAMYETWDYCIDRIEKALR